MTAGGARPAIAYAGLARRRPAMFARIFTAANEADGIDERTSERRGWSNWLRHPGTSFDPADDIVVAEVDGELVGYGWTEWVDTTDGLRDYGTRGHVHPAWRRRGVGTADPGVATRRACGALAAAARDRSAAGDRHLAPRAAVPARSRC